MGCCSVNLAGACVYVLTAVGDRKEVVAAGSAVISASCVAEKGRPAPDSSEEVVTHEGFDDVSVMVGLAAVGAGNC